MWIDIAQLIASAPPTAKEAQQIVDFAKRKAKARFYTDENFPSRATRILRHNGAEVTTAQDVQMHHYPDESHSAYALKHEMILLTCDRDYLGDRRFPLIKCPAIYVFQFGTGSDEDMQLAFRCLAPAFNTPQFIDKWMKVDASVNEWTERVRHLDGTTSRSRYRHFQGKVQQWVDDTE